MKKIIMFITFVLIISLFTSCTNETNNLVYKNDSWKKQIIIWWSTWCPHCVSAMPEFKEKIYDIYKESIDINVNSINWKKFDVEIPQNIDTSNMPEFFTVVWKECNYIPSFAVIDKESNVLLSSCWWEKTIDDIIKIIK